MTRWILDASACIGSAKLHVHVSSPAPPQPPDHVCAATRSHAPLGVYSTTGVHSSGAPLAPSITSTVQYSRAEPRLRTAGHSPEQPARKTVVAQVSHAC